MVHVVTFAVSFENFTEILRLNGDVALKKSNKN